MRPEEVETRIKAGEDGRTEFKSVDKSPSGLLDSQDVAREICAFANSGGGDIFVGVEDDGRLTGVGDAVAADKLDQQVANACKDILHPPILCQRLRVYVRGVLISVIRVPAFRPDRPFRSGHRYYVRDGAVTREARREELATLLTSAAHSYFDESEIAESSDEDMDELALREFFRTAYPDVPRDSYKRYMAALKIKSPDDKLTVLGMLLFGREPQKFLLDARVTAIRFPGVQIGGDFLDRREIGGRLLDQFRQSIEFIEGHLSAASHIEGATRREAGIPREIIREAIQNALAHRDYQAASQVRIFVFDDRVEIVNPGELLNRLTLDGIRLGGITQRRNPYLATVLARFQHRENAGIGVPEMIRRMHDQGLPEPEFVVADGHFRVILRTDAVTST